MYKDDAKQALVTIIERAESGTHTPCEFICEWQEYQYYKAVRNSLRQVLASLFYTAESLFKKHCREVVAGTADATKLLVRNTFLRSIIFYEEELEIVGDMLCEYEAYLAAGNFFNSFLGEIRPISERVDYRGE